MVVMTNGVGGRGAPAAGLPSARITADARAAVITGNPSACSGPDGKAAGAMNKPARNASLASTGWKPKAGAVTGSAVSTSGLTEALTGNVAHASRAARMSGRADSGIIVWRIYACRFRRIPGTS
jgi:hypothetical protein